MTEPGRWGAPVLGAPRDFCCAGCEAVAKTIVAAGFARYYEKRVAPGLAPQELPPAALYDDPLAQRQFVAAAGEHQRSATLILDRIRCAACVWLNQQVLQTLPGVTRVEVNYTTRRAQVAWDERHTRLSAIVEAIRRIGYDAYPYDPRRQEALDRGERRRALWRLFVAGFGAMQVMMYAIPAYLDEGGTLAGAPAGLMRWASLALTLPVILFSCGPFFSAAWRDLRRRRLSLETPIALGIAGGFAASAWATVAGRGEVYFDSITMLVFLLLGARYVELAARQNAARGLERLNRWMPSFALRLKGEASERVPAHAIVPGDLVLVPAGERAPADGLVERGASSADESLLTGEARPVPKATGAPLIGGSVNLEQPLVLRVTRAGAETQAAAIGRLVERAAASRPKLVEAADRIGAALTWIVVAAALLAYAASGDVWVAVAVLVVTCPCALALAAPVALTRASAQLLARGAVLTRARGIEALARATDVVLDKTGTLTSGAFRIVRTRVFGGMEAGRCVALAAALERGTRHPLARAFVSPEAAAVEGLKNFPGLGVEALSEGVRVRIGTQAFCAQLAGSTAPESQTRHTTVHLAREGGWLAQFELDDTLRPEAAGLVEAFKAAGLRIHLLSGDRQAAVESIAQRLGIETWRGAATPQDKFAYVERLQQQGRVVAMLGDGLNDAPVLARADVSLAMAGGADAAQLQSDFVLLGSRLDGAAHALALARRAMALVRQNFGWALAYNALALPAAAGGLIGPWEAALGMAASSFIVVLNTLRLPGAGASWKASGSSSHSRSLSYS